MSEPLAAPATFHSAVEAWFWTMRTLRARRDTNETPDPDNLADVIKRCLDTLYRRNRIKYEHCRILRIWGERQVAPRMANPAERCDARMWDETMDRLDWMLRTKGIVA